MIVMGRLGLGCSGSSVVARLRSNDASALALKGRKDQNINGLILRRFPRFLLANKDLR